MSKPAFVGADIGNPPAPLPGAAHAVMMYFLEIIAGRRRFNEATSWATKQGIFSVAHVLRQLGRLRPGPTCGARILRAAQPLPHCLEVVASLELGKRVRSCVMELREQRPVGWQLTHCQLI
ncbi:Rv3235 family protein [Natronoglycomyces albus]|uniref:Uncharacterized protein n=1 Tax=Natronoglycomyces albus TaxID=2811108 RepID=A0A895XHS1_9ACTN|nr:Rv3235 family protein [Natronoglycomyces albus]QSB04487.1 hypothetical protein JQS30_11940 [Natronoglycomyces albus]